MISHHFAKHLPDFALPARGEEQPDAELVILNEPLARSLGLDPEWLRSAEGIDFLLGHSVGEDTPHALGYAGYQFGQFNPRMGDGRALLLGEVSASAGDTGSGDADTAQLVDLHAKGTGPTPWSRPGSDGRGTLRSMLREYLYSEALHALGVPTTRGLAVLSTGRKISRRMVEPGGVHVRVAASHIRIGSFHLAASLGLARELADYTIARHYPHLLEANAADSNVESNTYRGLFRAALQEQMSTVAQWQRLGFIHGVMNTDNTTLSGQTIDFGPCAFMETYNEATWFSSIDTQGRYRFGQQPGILGWNFARLAESMLPLFDDNPDAAISFAQEEMNAFFPRFEEEFARQLAAVGIDDVEAYQREVAGQDLTAFNQRYVGPLVIPRAEHVEAALADAARGDMARFHRLLAAITHPWEPAPEFETPSERAFVQRYVTYCGT